MTFLHPALLAAGLAAISIPIIIHLLMHRRRKPVMWGAMRFLLEAYKRQRRKLMVEKWILLACRCLVLAMLAFALGRPLVGSIVPGRSGKTVYVLIDNGLTAGVRDAAGRTALERHKAEAKQVLAAVRSSASGESDRVGLIALGGPAEPIVMPASANLGSLDGLIDAIEPTDSKTDLSGGLAAVSAAINPQGQEPVRPDRTFVVVLSDFLDGSLDAGGGTDPAGGSDLAGVKLPAGVRLIASTPSPSSAANVSIVGMEPLRSVMVDSSRAPGAGAGEVSELVRVLLRRSGDGVSQEGVTTVRSQLSILDEQGNVVPGGPESASERATIRWTAGQEAATAIVPVRTDKKGARSGVTTGVLVGAIDDDALPADNRWRRPVELRESLRVGVIAPLRFSKPDRIDKLEPGAWAKLALAPAGERTGVDVVEIEPASLDGARLASLDAVVIVRPDLVAESAWARLKLFIEQGGLVVVCPPPGVSVHVWGDQMTRAFGLDWSIDREAKDVQAGKVTRGPTTAGAPGLLALVEGELNELISPVNVFKMLGMSPVPEGGERVLTLEDGTPLIWAGAIGATPPAGAAPAQSGRGLLVYCTLAMDLEWSDLPAKPLMVPLMQEIVRQGIGRARGSYTAIAGTKAGLPSRVGELQELTDPARSGERERASVSGRVRVDAGGVTSEALRRAGLWRAVDERGAVRGVVAFNPDARAGRTQAQAREAVAGVLRTSVGGSGDGAATPEDVAGAGEAIVWLPSGNAGSTALNVSGVDQALATVFGRADRGSPMSLPLLIAALVLAIAEIFLARRASHAEMTSVSGPSIADTVASREAA